MSLVLNTNIAALNATRNLSATQNAQAQTFQRLSTGLRINSAKDDAAGLYLAQAQTKDIRGLNMATRNANDGISMAQTAEGALDQITQNLQRINELAIQSANGTYSDAARDGLQKEVDQLTQEINRIVETTEFNGEKLLTPDAREAQLQVGFKNDANSRISTGLEGGVMGQLIPEDNMLNYTFGNGEQMYSLNKNDVVNGKTSDPQVVAAFNQQTREEFNLNFHPNDTTPTGFSFTPAIQAALESSIDENIATLGASQEGTFTFTTDEGIEFTYKLQAHTNPGELAVDGVTFDSIAFGDNSVDTATLAAINGAENNAAGANNVTLSAAFLTTPLVTTPETIFAAEVDVYAENALVGILDAGLTDEKTINISTQANAQFAIQQTREAIDFVSEIRATFGAVMNRFEAVISGNQIYSENLSAARSRIQDADFAVETSNLAKQQVLQQAGISSLAQANQSSQAILGLL